ncbi:hypothetical protein TCON_1909 [Astathelohania contejeani]|uniref:Uncharacterized protein n=1 Tax=Astathelohania contejeani TaxID=164912 RepID=A0ABQ7HXI4_9MICR|nr:hypothetical protein TCON_1909 [Thelohania contejeani]
MKVTFDFIKTIISIFYTALSSYIMSYCKYPSNESVNTIDIIFMDSFIGKYYTCFDNTFLQYQIKKIEENDKNTLIKNLSIIFNTNLSENDKYNYIVTISRYLPTFYYSIDLNITKALLMSLNQILAIKFINKNDIYDKARRDIDEISAKILFHSFGNTTKSHDYICFESKSNNGVIIRKINEEEDEYEYTNDIMNMCRNVEGEISKYYEQIQKNIFNENLDFISLKWVLFHFYFVNNSVSINNFNVMNERNIQELINSVIMIYEFSKKCNTLTIISCEILFYLLENHIHVNSNLFFTLDSHFKQSGLVYNILSKSLYQMQSKSYSDMSRLKRMYELINTIFFMGHNNNLITELFETIVYFKFDPTIIIEIREYLVLCNTEVILMFDNFRVYWFKNINYFLDVLIFLDTSDNDFNEKYLLHLLESIKKSVIEYTVSKQKEGAEFKLETYPSSPFFVLLVLSLEAKYKKGIINCVCSFGNKLKKYGNDLMKGYSKLPKKDIQKAKFYITNYIIFLEWLQGIKPKEFTIEFNIFYIRIAQKCINTILNSKEKSKIQYYYKLMQEKLKVRIFNK